VRPIYRLRGELSCLDYFPLSPRTVSTEAQPTEQTVLKVFVQPILAREELFPEIGDLSDEVREVFLNVAQLLVQVLFLPALPIVFYGSSVVLSLIFLKLDILAVIAVLLETQYLELLLKGAKAAIAFIPQRVLERFRALNVEDMIPGIIVVGGVLADVIEEGDELQSGEIFGSVASRRRQL
jgi:hypothetical protein